MVVWSSIQNNEAIKMRQSAFATALQRWKRTQRPIRHTRNARIVRCESSAEWNWCDFTVSQPTKTKILWPYSMYTKALFGGIRFLFFRREIVFSAFGQVWCHSSQPINAIAPNNASFTCKCAKGLSKHENQNEPKNPPFFMSSRAVRAAQSAISQNVTIR